MNPKKVLSHWFALHLSVGIVSATLLRPVLGTTTGYFAGTGIALVAALVLLQSNPERESGPLWRLGLLTLLAYVVLRLGGTATGMSDQLSEQMRALLALAVAAVLQGLRKIS